MSDQKANILNLNNSESWESCCDKLIHCQEKQEKE